MTQRIAMDIRVIVGIACLGAAAAPGAPSPTLAEKLCSAYEQVETLSCRVRMTGELDGRKATLLSRVYYRRPDRMHVENISPVKRRIISDGSNFYHYVEGMARGFSAPLDKLEGEWAIQQKSVPGSAMEHLLRLKGVPETPLNGTDKYPVRRGYAHEKAFVVLSCDTEGRLARIEFFKSSEMTVKTAQIEYEDFQKVSDTCWLARIQKGGAAFGGNVACGTRRFDNMVVNKSISDSLFDAGAFFKGIEFEDDLEKLSGEPKNQ